MPTSAYSVAFELYPIRIDVGYPPPPPVSAEATTSNAPSTTYSIRILDTILVDPRDISSRSDPSSLYQQWAHSVVTDAMVVGTTRAMKKAEAASSTETTFTGRVETMVTAAGNGAAPQLLDTAKVQQYLMPQVQRQIQSQCRTLLRYHASARSKRIGTNASASNMVPIRLRIELPPPQRIRIHDDFLYDLSCSDAVTPLQVAQSMVTDLRLPHDAVSILTIHIMEQILLHIQNLKSPPLSALEMDDDSPNDDGKNMGPLRSSNHRSVTAAWEITDAIQATNVRHLEVAASRS